MTKTEQKRFVRELSSTIAKEVIQLIQSGHVPAEWDGHELRVYLRDRYEESARMSLCHEGKGARYWRRKNYLYTLSIVGPL